jgi:hypothetical protein
LLLVTMLHALTAMLAVRLLLIHNELPKSKRRLTSFIKALWV